MDTVFLPTAQPSNDYSVNKNYSIPTSKFRVLSVHKVADNFSPIPCDILQNCHKFYPSSLYPCNSCFNVTLYLFPSRGVFPHPLVPVMTPWHGLL